MSTFDGFVKEFPLVRIDYFRADPGRPRPRACLLSHIHSDHLLGLESLKMPFVYCSATTRRLLLKIEKYPHRINFAKGILESRKQHYRHLKTVLRELPLQTSTEIELTPKEKIQVTLFDANHCPGAVMFLIQGDGKAVLYTGDVRAEPWWVNSVVQNPVLLPYAYGLKLLDCIYLDTTFATHEDRYKSFPTKAEGIRELMTKIAACPSDSIFYFRAWTLGYEQVWIALANMLQCTVHVDEYQIGLFGSIVDDGKDGYGMFEGPPLVGFKVGNDFQPGLLSRDSSTRLHSCDPGMACHQTLKKKNVIWITPIISRLSDGTELLELGAGGGGGDLYQAPELEVTDEFTLHNLELFCKDLANGETAFKTIREALKGARESGSSKISLEGLGLESDIEVSLNDLAKLMSQQKDERSRKTAKAAKTGQRLRQTIHFPFSRHSSYEELRHLVSVFRPQEVHACTVDIATWSEEVSMKALFGDLCSGTSFQHDALVRLDVAAVREQQDASRLKRKRQEESQEEQEEEQLASSQSPSFHSALHAQSKRVETPQVLTNDSKVLSPGTSVTGGIELHSQRPLTLRQDKDYGLASLDARVAKIKDEFHKLNNGSETVVYDVEERQDDMDLHDQDPSQVSLTTSAFDSQENDAMSDELIAMPVTSRNGATDSRGGPLRASARQEAYRLARQSVRTGDSGGWEDMSLRSVGRSGHVERETEL